MSEITTIGLDLAKQVFHVVGCDVRGKQVMRKRLRRGQMHGYFANVPACTVAMEGCASAHYWGRQLQGLGHRVRLIPAQHVKAYVRGNKNDYNDAARDCRGVSLPGPSGGFVEDGAPAGRAGVASSAGESGQGSHGALQPGTRAAGRVRGGAQARGGHGAPGAARGA